MRRSKGQQVKEVVEGLALGVLAQGVVVVASNKMALEFAFNHAWSRWSRARDFPSIKGHDPGNLFWLGMFKSERRQGVRAAWDTDRWTEPYITLQDWTIDETLNLHADAEVSAEGWRELGCLFVEDFEPEEIQRS